MSELEFWIMKAGDSFVCPFCGRDTFLKKESKMDGWVKIGEVLKCVACNAEVEALTPSSQVASQDSKTNASQALLELLGETPPKPVSSPFEGETVAFCRDCSFMVANAFRMYCSKHDKDVNSMDDCPDFRNRHQTGDQKK